MYIIIIFFKKMYVFFKRLERISNDTDILYQIFFSYNFDFEPERISNFIP